MTEFRSGKFDNKGLFGAIRLNYAILLDQAQEYADTAYRVTSFHNLGLEAELLTRFDKFMKPDEKKPTKSFSTAKIQQGYKMDQIYERLTKLAPEKRGSTTAQLTIKSATITTKLPIFNDAELIEKDWRSVRELSNTTHQLPAITYLPIALSEVIATGGIGGIKAEMRLGIQYLFAMTMLGPRLEYRPLSVLTLEEEAQERITELASSYADTSSSPTKRNFTEEGKQKSTKPLYLRE